MKQSLRILFCLVLSAQCMSQSLDSLSNLSLEELMNVPIESASKKKEKLFDAPLSSYTITRSDIDKAGSTSIMEALRLAPGLIVREESNGNYDIHIRGFDNLGAPAQSYAKLSTVILVMIDNRPIFNYLNGGTDWESLPIDIVDVDRIEIVRGPSSSLFGPNAVAGVINIFTKRYQSTKLFANGNAAYGTPSSGIANLHIGQSIGKFSYLVSGNHQNRNRFDQNYYNQSTGQYVPLQQLGGTSASYFPNSRQSSLRDGANCFLTFTPSDKTSYDLSVGLQSSQTLRLYGGGLGTTFSTVANNSYYINLAAKFHNFKIRASQRNGSLDAQRNTINDKTGLLYYYVSDVNVEHLIKASNKLTFTPGASLQSTTYSSAGIAFRGKSPTLNTTSFMLRSDFNPSEKLRFFGSIRADKFTDPSKIYIAYQLASTFKFNERNLIRAALTRSNNSSFIANNYLNFVVPTEAPGVNFTASGNTNLRLLTINMIEIGYRVQVARNFQIDIDLFNQRLKDLSLVIPLTQLSTGYQNLPISATQNGMTISLNYALSDKLQFKPFATFQTTEIHDEPSQYVSPSLNPTITYSNQHNKNTPGYYGGYFLEYQLTSKLRINVNGYFFKNHYQTDPSDPTNAFGTSNINGKMLTNVKVSYRMLDQLDVYFNGRNIFNNPSREFYGADRTAGLYMVGAMFKF
jgi:iron complex outermembrane receptor protein